MAIIVRRATENDLSALRDLQAYPVHALVDQHFAQQQAGQLVYAVACEEDVILGSALLDFASESIPPELRNMFVVPEARRRGLGRALSTWIEEQARQAGYSAVFLAVDPNNERAVPLYVSLEYHPTGEHLFVDNPEVQQVPDESQASTHYAVYKKSLTAR
mgnify:CR=1 FL=1